MRVFATVVLFVSLGPALARAGDTTPKTKEGGSGGAATITSSSTAGATTEQVYDDQARRLPGEEQSKRWAMDAVWETHAMLIPWNIDHEGAGRAKLLNLGFLAARVDVTKNNHISARAGFYQYAIADEQETGVRAADIIVAYTRTQPLPKGLELKLKASLSAPVSFYSQEASLITAPAGSVGLDYEWKGLTVELVFFGGYFWTKYTTEAGGNPNARANFGGELSVEYKLPFWKERLSLGGDVNDGYVWFYDVGTPPPGESGLPNAVKDATFPSQPVSQSYGGELFVHLSIPDARVMKFDITAAYANGDPSLGYDSVLHDGAGHVYPWFWRLSSNVYVSLAAHY